jgi:hypothetical protein
VVSAPRPPKPPTFRRTVRGTASVLPAPPVEPARRPPTRGRRIVGAVVALVVVAGGLTAYLARPGATPVATPVDRLTTLYLPTAGAVGGVADSQAVASQGAHPALSATHGPSPSARPSTQVAVPPPGATSPSAKANPAGNNLALGKPTDASSTEADAFDAREAVDGDTGTRWSSQWNDPQWIRVDLGSVWSVSAVKLQWETAHATRYTIQTSTDGSTWTVVKAVGNGNGGIENLSFPAVPARYVMMFGTHRSSGYGYSLWEFEIR